MGIGQPDMDGPETRLGAEAAQGEQERNAAQPRRCRPDPSHGGEVETACRAGQQGEQDQEENHADVGRDEIGRAGTPDLLAIIVEGHQEE